MSFNASQKSAIQQFVTFTGASERTAGKVLKQYSWNVERAADAFFNSGGKSSSSTPTPAQQSSTHALNAIFDQYREKDDAPDTMGVNGCMKYLQAINVNLEEPAVLVIAELLKAPSVGEFSRQGFVDGWKEQGVETLQQMRNLVPGFRQSFEQDDAFFKKVYLYTFQCARTPPQKSLQLDVASAYWSLLLAGRFDEHLPSWLEFIEKEYKKAISKDMWNCMYDFVQLAKKDSTLGNYDVNGAWPSVLDEFVEYYRKMHGMDTS